MESPSDLTMFGGRLHLVLLHLPIGFLLLLGVLELISLHPKWRHATLSNPFILWLCAPITVLTAACGWLLAESGGYDERLLFLHRWTGVGVAAAACLLLWIHSRGWMRLYRLLVLVTMALTLVTGHLGGSLTHGSDFLTRYAPAWVRNSLGSVGEDAGQGDDANPDFAAVESVFSEYCFSCHGPEKSKGGLRLDSMEHIREGGEAGPVVVAGDADASLLMKRVQLPLNDDDHMPPEGKPQPSVHDLELIRTWIEAGAIE